MEKITISLTDGRKINLELYPEIAPISVANFLKLVDDGYYNGLCFHRVIPNFMIQGGGMFAGDGCKLLPKSGLEPIKGEFIANGVKNDLKHTLGVISMARTSDPNSATSQFFICVADCGSLDGQYAAFGKTADAESNKIIIDISKVKTGSYSYYDDIPIAPVIIEKIERI